MNFSDFENTIIPLAKKIGYMPNTLPVKIYDQLILDLFDSCLNAKNSWVAQSYMFDRWVYLNLDFKHLVDSVFALMNTHRSMNNFISQGFSEVSTVCHQALPGCLDGEHILIRDLVDGFESLGCRGEVIPRLNCPKNFLDGGGLCNCRILPSVNLPEDISWLNEILK